MYHRFLFFILIVSFSVSADVSDSERYNSGWRINIDNDLLTGQSTDRDYTGGLAFTMSGRRAQQYPVTIDSWRAGLDRLLGFPALYPDAGQLSFHSQQYGMTLFTPDDIDSDLPVYDDRPYASLFFLSNTEFNVFPEKNMAYTSRLSIGFLGLDAAEWVQKGLHGLTDSSVPNGWQYQVSAGGEPTAMLTYAVQKNLLAPGDHQLKMEYEANIGFVTDINAGINWRWGRISSRWWTFNPYQSKYVQQSMPVFSNESAGMRHEYFFWAGARLNLRLYNAFLQGQFRHSEVAISSDQLERLVAEYWLGGTYVFAGLYTASIFVRGHSEEFKGPNARSASWIGLMFSRSY